jgi:hypothetical protein
VGLLTYEQRHQSAARQTNRVWTARMNQSIGSRTDGPHSPTEPCLLGELGVWRGPWKFLLLSTTVLVQSSLCQAQASTSLTLLTCM